MLGDMLSGGCDSGGCVHSRIGNRQGARRHHLKKTSIACEKLGSRMAGPGQCHPGSSLNVSLCCCFACFARGRGPDLDFPPSAASSVASHPSRWSR